NVKNTLKSVDKYSEYEERYVAFSASDSPPNSAFKQVNFARTFSTIPFIQITLDIQDTTPRLAYYANVTTTGFQIGSNYGGAVKGVWYKAYVK
ncbi:H-type lectin domain-containing protein, partial [Staphylococcus aureus]|uniref:H-type lectin domain-containing protein n=1 Tax=Staphylococcus aureus TaxID=1280 RepID=UPI0019E72207